MQSIGKIAKDYADLDRNGKFKHMNINIIPNNSEQYMCFMLCEHLTFIDSFQFMSSFLDKLVANLPKNDLKNVSKVYKGERFELLTRKGIYPYDYIDSFERFDETELPAKQHFYNALNDQHISSEDYEHTKKVWKKFKIKSMGQYHIFIFI